MVKEEDKPKVATLVPAEESPVRKPKSKKVARGTLFIRGLPLGFAEPQLKKWFSQFGKVTRVTIARSTKSANPKGFGFIEFENKDVARVVAESVPRYMMFNKTLHLSYKEDITKEVADRVFKNSNRRWHRMDRFAQAQKFLAQRRSAATPTSSSLRRRCQKLASAGISSEEVPAALTSITF